jgi:hypothetical protein
MEENPTEEMSIASAIPNAAPTFQNVVSTIRDAVPQMTANVMNSAADLRNIVIGYTGGISNRIVNTQSLFRIGFKKMCKLNSEFISSIRDLQMSCVARLENAETRIINENASLNAANDFIYDMLERMNCIFVLDCGELQAEQGFYSDEEFQMYLDDCADNNLVTASMNPDVLTQVNQSFLEYQRSMNNDLTIHTFTRPNDHAVLYFLIELMFTPGGPSYVTNVTQGDVIELYRIVTKDRRKINKAAQKADLSIVLDEKGDPVVTKPRYVGEASKKGKKYPRGTPLGTISKDYPVLGDFNTQRKKYLEDQIATAEKVLTDRGVLYKDPHERRNQIQSSIENRREKQRKQSLKNSQQKRSNAINERRGLNQPISLGEGMQLGSEEYKEGFDDDDYVVGLRGGIHKKTKKNKNKRRKTQQKNKGKKRSNKKTMKRRKNRN